MKPFDDEPTLIDRLIDNELAPDERRQLLARLESSPGGWRRCALAFVESQALRGCLNELAQPAATNQPLAAPTKAAGADAPLPRAAWYATAAAVLLAVGIGLGRSGLPGLGPVVEPPPSIASTTSPPAPTVAAGNGPNDTLTLWVADETGKRRTLRAPLVDAAELEKQTGLTFVSGLRPEAQRRLEMEGYRVKSRRRYAPLFVEGGRPIVVPVEDYQITPVALTRL